MKKIINKTLITKIKTIILNIIITLNSMYTTTFSKRCIKQIKINHNSNKYSHKAPWEHNKKKDLVNFKNNNNKKKINKNKTNK